MDSGSTAWVMVDDKRNTYNQFGEYMSAEGTQADTTDTILDMLSNGFKFRDNDLNWNNTTDRYLYYAIAKNPFKFANAR